MQEITNNIGQNELNNESSDTLDYVSNSVTIRLKCLELFEQINDSIRDNDIPLFDNLCIEDLIDLLY